MSQKIAVAHEHFLGYGGGEYVASELARIFDAPLYSGAVEEPNTPDDVNIESVVRGWVGHKLTHMGAAPRDLYYMLRWPNVDLTQYDVIIQSGNNPGWYVPEDTQTIIKYVHSTPRGPYDLYHEHGGRGVIGTVFNHVVRTLYQQAIHYPDVFVANSELVKRRLERYWSIPSEDIEVVYPPVQTEQYSPDLAKTDDVYFAWSRLYGHKNMDQIVHAFNELGYSLIIGGEGPERDNLEELANENISFVGWMSEDEKARLASEAKAVVFAATNEDFGLVPVEAMASGTPVIGIKDGFTQHQIIHGENGRTFDPELMPESVRLAVETFENTGVAWQENEIAEWAETNFGRDRFIEKMREIVTSTRDETDIEVNYENP